jgi:hypothetical protein
MLLLVPVVLVDISIQFPLLIFTPACRSVSMGEDDLFHQVDWEHGRDMPSYMTHTAAQLEMAATSQGLCTYESMKPEPETALLLLLLRAGCPVIWQCIML